MASQMMSAASGVASQSSRVRLTSRTLSWCSVCVGPLDGATVEGAQVGNGVVGSMVGNSVGSFVGLLLGPSVGLTVGTLVVGFHVGSAVVGLHVGL